MKKLLISTLLLFGACQTSEHRPESWNIVEAQKDVEVSTEIKPTYSNLVSTAVPITSEQISNLKNYHTIRLLLKGVKISSGVEAWVYLGGQLDSLRLRWYAQNHEEVETLNNPYYLGSITGCDTMSSYGYHISDDGRVNLDAMVNLIGLQKELVAGQLPVVLKANRVHPGGPLDVQLKSAELEFR